MCSLLKISCSHTTGPFTGMAICPRWSGIASTPTDALWTFNCQWNSGLDHSFHRLPQLLSRAYPLSPATVVEEEGEAVTEEAVVEEPVEDLPTPAKDSLQEPSNHE